MHKKCRFYKHNLYWTAYNAAFVHVPESDLIQSRLSYATFQGTSWKRSHMTGSRLIQTQATRHHFMYCLHVYTSNILFKCKIHYILIYWVDVFFKEAIRDMFTKLKQNIKAFNFKGFERMLLLYQCTVWTISICKQYDTNLSIIAINTPNKDRLSLWLNGINDGE